MEFEDLSGASWRDEGYVYLFVARDRASCQLLVRVWLDPTISCRNRATMTCVVVEGLAAWLEMKRRCSEPGAPHSPSASGPWGHDATLRNVFSLTVIGVAGDYDSCAAPHQSAPLMGATPSRGEQHLRAPPDDLPRCSADWYFAVRQMLPSEDVESLPQILRDRRSAVE